MPQAHERAPAERAGPVPCAGSSPPAAPRGRHGAIERVRPCLLLLPVLATTLSGTLLAGRALGAAGPLRWPLLGLLAVNLLCLALSGWPTVLGFLARGARRPPLAPPLPPCGRTAVLLPVHNEDPARVFPAVEVMAGAFAAAGLSMVDLHVLSDTRGGAVARAEEAALQALARRGVAVQYRRRLANTGRKAGNIAEFCARCGAAYDYMVVLDADSLMTAGAVATLIGLMDANPGAGLIQSVPYAASRETLFARWQQFAMRLYTPLWAAGSAIWHGASGNYWGHNAIMRVAAFRRHCRLPILRGHAPFGGEILCHDVVEAALLRRAGWGVFLLHDLPGSYEELPANLLDHAVRERRWCQGNLQHARLLCTRGLRGASRLHLAIGILHYLSGPCWVAMLALTPALPAPSALAAARTISGLVLALVLGPKLLSLGAALADRPLSRRWGGRRKLLLSALAEQALTMLSAPITLVFHARFVATTLAGRIVPWDAQPRGDRGVGWAESWRRLRAHALLGTAWLGWLAARHPALVPWALPAAAGLLAAVPFAAWSSRVPLGRAAARAGLFVTEDERSPARELGAYRAALAGPPLRRAAARAAAPSPVRALDGTG